MTIRDAARNWMREHYIADSRLAMRASKYYPDQELWFFTFPTSFFDAGKSGHLCILLQSRKSPNTFHYLKVPFTFFRDNMARFDIRADGGKFDLHISAKACNWLVDERSSGVDFSEFENAP